MLGLGRIRCLFQDHDFKLVDQEGNLRVEKCERCNTHLNIHRPHNDYYLSSERNSLLRGIKLLRNIKQDKE